jgi:lysophospholipase L1-like esterase
MTANRTQLPRRTLLAGAATLAALPAAMTAAPTTASAAKPGLLPVGARVCCIGDSQIMENERTRGNTMMANGGGEFTWASFLGGNFRWDTPSLGNTGPGAGANRAPGKGGTGTGFAGSNLGTPDLSSEWMADHVDLLLNEKPDVAAISIGSNDLKTGLSAKTVFANIKSTIDRIVAKQIPVIVTTVRPVNSAVAIAYTAAVRDNIMALNDMIRGLGATPGIIVCDLYDTYTVASGRHVDHVNWQDMAPELVTQDGRHLSNDAAYVGGKALLATINTLVAPGNYMHSQYWQKGGNLIPTEQAAFTGTPVAFGNAGNVPGGILFRIKGSGSAAETATVKILPTNGASPSISTPNAHSLQVRISVSPNGSVAKGAYISLQLENHPVFSNRGVYLVGWVEVEIDEWAGWSGSHLYMWGGRGSMGDVALETSPASRLVSMKKRLYVRTAPLLVAEPPNELFIGYDVFYRPDTPGVAGTSGLCTFHRWGIWQYEDPREAFHII